MIKSNICMFIFYLISCATEEKTLDIGIFFLETGYASSLEPLKNGMDLAANEINSMGRKNNHLIVLHYKDIESNPEIARDLFIEFEKEINPDLYFPIYSSVATAIADQIKEIKKPAIALVAADPRVAELNEYMFSYYMAAVDQLNAMKQVILQNQITNLGILYQKDEFGNALFRVFKDWASTQEIEVIGKNSDSIFIHLNMDFIYPGVFGSVMKTPDSRIFRIPLFTAQYRGGQYRFLNY